MEVSIKILDCSVGMAAADIGVSLLREVDADWKEEARACTDEVGSAIMGVDSGAARGRYRLIFDLDRHFAALGVAPLHSQAEIAFRVLTSDASLRFIVALTPSSTAIYTVPSGS